MDVTTWYLEQTDPSDLRPARPPRDHVDVVRAEIPSADFHRFLYSAVGGGWQWTDRRDWTDDQWLTWLDLGVETWVAYLRGTPAGYIALEPQGSSVEVAYFGLLPFAIGRGIGGHLLHTGVARAWQLASERVWVHTCSLDSPAARGNYEARGFRLYKTEVSKV
ncbi:GNAT family N-acetyltransferase [Herbidospora sp. NBRC 101105]|uniref:GNAT family N-acetyltransferase n=1 Tax=Herbidospora sp. NBRC 101105 TaxID=3032195 RepID=UPI0024A0597C|nr:GNAT family N-acetyltransferase [Herbidospora sp. NBRC 101105]GLX94597.1 N-acetyltransferase [Herbidospora sp. NBRC 101105]